MKTFFFLIFCIFAISCSQTASKNTDLKSPCAGCDDRISPSGNLKYLTI